MSLVLNAYAVTPRQIRCAAADVRSPIEAACEGVILRALTLAMTPEGWETVKELFQLALERAPNERRAFLDAFCRDNAELRREVESLLAHATASDRLLEDPIRKRIGVANTSGGPNALAPHWVPATIGRYRVLSLIGEGGMGAVYKAEQELPRRIVALKIIKPGLANADVLRRFDRESQALGRLQHPGIAQIHEAGTADTGFGAQPYASN